MTLKKLFLKIILVFFVLVIAFCGLLYYTLRTKVADISDQKPFIDFIDKEMILGQDAILVNNYEHFVNQEPLYLDAVGSQLYDGTSIAHYLKKGDTVIINSAKDFTNGTSGFTNTTIFGTVKTGNPSSTIPFEYDWETQTIEEDPAGISVFKFKLAE